MINWRKGTSATPINGPNDVSNPLKKGERKFFYGWVVVIASFFVAMMAYGGAYSFGVFLKPLRQDFGWTSAATSGAYSFFILFYCSFSIPSGWAVDKLGPRITIGLGGLLIGLGLFFTSKVNALWHIYITYGLLIGSGMSTIYNPLSTTTSRWFTKRRGLALGIVMAGVGVGTLIIPPLASYFISTHGWRLSYLFMGPVIGGIIITGALFLRKDIAQRKMAPDGQTPPKILNKKGSKTSSVIGVSLEEAFGTKVFWLICVMHLLVGFALQMMLVHLVSYVLEGLTLSLMVAATVLSSMGAASIFGRLIMGAASDHIGNKRALAISTSIQGVMIIGFLVSSSAWMLYLFAAIYGFGYGGHTPQFPALAGELFGLRRMGTILGTQVIFYGIGGALGPFLAGHIFDTTGSYTNAFTLAAMAMLLTTAFTFLLKKPKSMERSL